MFGGRIGMTELIVLLVIVLLLFGANNLPKLARSVGKSIRELKDGLADVGQDLQDALKEPHKNESQPTPPAKNADENPDQTKNA
ncbi:MAG: twin-arginine translocase TatA/TatE family subunit [Deltaproteobacteria bacterium]|nr:twin-arginine translocase TatA/TatE family subunit [Deltaproteobacteria bacterium]